MPFGSHSSLADITQLVCLNNPNSFLDLGIGNGMNGAMIRNYCGRDRLLVGVEGFGEYNNPMWSLYSKIEIKPIQEFEPSQKFDCIICSDVIEHFDKLDGIDQINKWKCWLNDNGVLIISTPAIWIEQGDVNGNSFERHRSLWSEQDFINLGFTIYRNSEPCKYGHIMIVAEYLNR